MSQRKILSTMVNKKSFILGLLAVLTFSSSTLAQECLESSFISAFLHQDKTIIIQSLIKKGWVMTDQNKNTAIQIEGLSIDSDLSMWLSLIHI